jgi:hypothetical protein
MFEIGYFIRVAILLVCIAILYHDRRQLNGSALLIIGMFFGLLAQSCYDILVIGNDPVRFTISSIVAGFALASTLHFHHQRGAYAEARRNQAVADEVERKNAELIAGHERRMAKIVGKDYDQVINELH